RVNGGGRGSVRAGNSGGSDGAPPSRRPWRARTEPALPGYPWKGSEAMRVGRRVAEACFWGLVFCLSVLGGGLWFAYTYVPASANAANSIRQYAVRYLPTSEVDPGRVRVARWFNEVTLHNTRVYQKIRGIPFQTLYIPWLNVQVNTRKLLHGELD